MRLLPIILVGLLTLAGCGRSDAEQRYVERVSAGRSSAEQTRMLEQGREICDAVGKIEKGDPRDYVIFRLKSDPRFGWTMTTAAIEVLCPQVGRA